MNKNLTGTMYFYKITDAKNYLLLFLLWPFLAFLTAVANYSHKNAKKVVYIFLIYYGLTFVIADIYVDSYRYALTLRENSFLQFSEFINFLRGYNTTTETADLIEPIITFIVSRFTTYHGVLFAVFAALFGFFYLKSINILHNFYIKSANLNAFIFMAFFVFIIPITQINGVRMYTAAWIFFYGAINVILYRKTSFLIIALSSSLMHFSFLAASAVLIVYFFAGNRNIIYIPLVVLSFILPQLLMPVFQSGASSLGGAIQDRFEGYSDQDYIVAIQESRERTAWFLGLSDDMVFYYLLFAIIIIQLIGNSKKDDQTQKNLFSFSMLFLAFVNFGKAIPTFGGRFQDVFYLFAVFYVFLYMLKTPGRKYNLLTILGLFPFILYAVVKLRIGSESINAFIFTPGLGIPLFNSDLSLAKLLFY